MYSENIKIGSKGITFTDKHGNKLTFSQSMRKAGLRIVNWYLDFKLFLIHIVSLHIPSWTIRKLVLEFSGLKLGKGTVLHMGCKFFDPRNIVIGYDTKIGDRTFLDGRDKLTIGNHVDIASEVMVYNSEHDIESTTFEAKNEPVTIGDHVFIGPRAIILPGITIGQGAIIAAGAVVTNKVEPFSVVAGVPAKKIADRKNKNLTYSLGRARLFQ